MRVDVEAARAVRAVGPGRPLRAAGRGPVVEGAAEVRGGGGGAGAGAGRGCEGQAVMARGGGEAVGSAGGRRGGAARGRVGAGDLRSGSREEGAPRQRAGEEDRRPWKQWRTFAGGCNHCARETVCGVCFQGAQALCGFGQHNLIPTKAKAALLQGAASDIDLEEVPKEDGTLVLAMASSHVQNSQPLRTCNISGTVLSLCHIQYQYLRRGCNPSFPNLRQEFTYL